jgi:hypothetical protein
MTTPLLQTTLDFQQAAKTQNLTGAATTFPDLISGILSGVMIFGALLVLMYYIWAAIEWITAGGDSSKIEKARTKIMQSTIGLIVLSTALAFFVLLQNFLGITILKVGGSSSSSSSTRTGSTLDSGRSGSSTNSLRDAFEDATDDSSGSTNSLLESFQDRFGSSDEEIRQESFRDSIQTDIEENNFADFELNENLVTQAGDDAVSAAIQDNPNISPTQLRAIRIHAEDVEERRQADEYRASQQ